MFSGTLPRLCADMKQPAHQHQFERLEPRAMMAASPVHDAEMAAMMALVPDSAVNIAAVLNGQWSDPTTWQGGRLPGAGENVLIPTGLSVLLDSMEAARLKTIRVDGALSFSPAAETRLLVDTLVVTAGGNLTMGTATDPVTSRATLTFLDTGSLESSFARGLISHGTISIHGIEKTPWAYLLSSPLAGDTTLVFAQPISGWSIGDTLLIPGTSRKAVQDELRVIGAINGNTVQIAPLTYSHRTPAGEALLLLPVANMTRNVVLQSENTVNVARRGHVMLMHNAAVDVAFASFYGLGRTDKSQFVSDANGNNPRGRYSLHFHRNDRSQQINVNGIVVEDSPGWGAVNHSANVLVENSVSYRVFGAGFVGEAGDEVGEFRNNLAIRSRPVASTEGSAPRIAIGDFGWAGHGFWTQGPGIAVRGNAASGHAAAAFVLYAKGYIEPDTGLVANPGSRSQPFAGFSDNLAFASECGIETLYNMTNSEVENCTVWGTAIGARGWQGLVRIVGGTYLGYLAPGDKFRGSQGYGIEFRSGYNGMGSVYNATVKGWIIGSAAPRENVSIYDGGAWDNQVDFDIRPPYDGSLTIRNIESPTFWLREINGLPQVRGTFGNNAPEFPEFYYKSRPIAVDENGGVRYLFFHSQIPSFVPFTTGPFTGLSNQNIFDQYGLLPYGAMAPTNAIQQADFSGVVYYDSSQPGGYAADVALLSKPSSKTDAYNLKYFWDGMTVTENVTLVAGWNLLTRDRNGVKYTFLVVR